MARRVEPGVADFKIGNSRYASRMRCWLNGDTWELTPGVDFDESVEAFRAHCRYLRRQYGNRIMTRFRDGKLYIRCDPPASDGCPEEILRALEGGR